MIARSSAILALCLLLALPGVVQAATLLSNIGEANNKGTNIFRSNIWTAVRFTAGAGATITSVTLNLDETYGNYTGSGTHTGAEIRFYNDNSGVVGSAISGTLGYTSTDTGNGHTVYADASGTITLPSAGDYWLAMTCDTCANVSYEETDSTDFSGATDWETIIDDATVSTSNNDGSSWNTPYSSSTFGMALYTIEGTETDNTAPTVSTFSPADGATEVGQDDNLIITFDEAVDAETGNITIKNGSDDTAVGTIDVTSGLVTGSGSTEITINFATTLDAQTDYYVQIDDSAFDDAADNSYAGISDTATWNFTTGGTVPTVAASSDSGGGGTFLDNSDGGTISLLPTVADVAAQDSDPSEDAPTVDPGQPASFDVKIPDADQVQRVYVRILGVEIDLDNSHAEEFDYAISFAAPEEAGTYPYTLTADYGIFDLSTKGDLVVEEEKTDEDLVTKLFTAVHNRIPATEEVDYWVDRSSEVTKQEEDELYGAMQWQHQFGVSSSRLVGTVAGALSPLN